MMICHCHRVSDEHIDRVIDAGARTLPQVVRATRAGTGCGGCLPWLRTLCEQASADAVRGCAEETLAG